MESQEGIRAIDHKKILVSKRVYDEMVRLAHKATEPIVKQMIDISNHCSNTKIVIEKGVVKTTVIIPEEVQKAYDKLSKHRNYIYEFIFKDVIVLEDESSNMQRFADYFSRL